MAVAFDAQTKSTAFTHGTLGTITYGGVTLNLVTEAHDNTTEILGAYVYFRGSGIPSGAQTVEIKDSGGSTLTSFTHTPVGTPSGVLVFVGDAVDALLSIA